MIQKTAMVQCDLFQCAVIAKKKKVTMIHHA